MPAKDIYHDSCKNSLIKDNWTITDDPLRIQWGSKDMYIDLGAKQLFAAELNERKIAVEVKRFIGSSEIEDLKLALGQYVLYRNVLSARDSDRKLYLAIRGTVYRELFREALG